MRQESVQERIHCADNLLPTVTSDIHMRYDPEADAAYLTIDPDVIGKVARTVELQDWLLADFDKDGKLLGIEMLFVSSNLPASSVRELRAAAV